MINCEELITFSSVEPTHRVFVLKSKSSFISSQNCLVFEFNGKKFAVCCLYDLKHVVADSRTYSREQVNEKAKFYLFESEPVSFLGTLLDEKLFRFYEEVYSNNTSVKCRIGNFNPDYEQLASFAVFEYRGKKEFPLLSKLHSQAPPLQLGEDILVLTNSFALAFKDLFSKTVYKAVCSSNTKYGMFLTDLRGFPDIEGGLVFAAGKSPTPVGIVVPGMFHKNNYREYLTICYRLDHFADQFFTFASTQLLEYSLSGLGRIGQIHRHLTSSMMSFSGQNSTSNHRLLSPTDCNTYANPAIAFWANRVFKIAIYSPSSNSISTATGIAINEHLVLTNQHIVSDRLEEVYVYNDGEKVLARKILPSNGSLDVLFFIVEKPLKVSQVPTFKRSIDLFAQTNELGETIYSIGYPIFRPRSSFNFMPFVSKGLLQNEWSSKHFKQPLLLLTNNLIFQGNSGGALVNEKGQLVALTFATLKINTYDSGIGECVLNEVPVSVSLANIADELSRAMEESTDEGLSKCILGLPYLHLKDEEIREAMNFYVERKSFADRC